jgi:hypothetical protein
MPSEKAGTDAFLDEVVLHALEREPQRRYQHASEVKTDVQRGAGRERATPRVWPGGPSPRERVREPSRALMLVGVVYTVLAVIASFVWIMAAITDQPQIPVIGALPMGLGLLVLMVQGPVIIVGSLRMGNLEAHGLAFASAILALLPSSPCALLGLPVGIWALVVLTTPEVKAAFARGGPL